MSFAAVGDVTNLTTDLFPVGPGSQVALQVIEARNSGGASDLYVQYAFLFYTASGAYISTSTYSNHGAGPVAQSASYGTAVLVPLNARSARAEITTWETGTHDASTYYILGSVASGVSTPFIEFLGDLTVDGGIYANAAHFTQLYLSGGMELRDTTGNSLLGLIFGSDTRLYRSSAGVLTDSGALVVTGDMTAATINGTAPGVFGLTLLSEATASAARSSLGLGTGYAEAALVNALAITPASVVASGNVQTGAYIIIDNAAGTTRDVHFTTATSTRWAWRCDATAEGGANAGSNFAVRCYDDTGTLLFTPLTIIRSTGVISMTKGLSVTSNINATATFSVAATQVVSTRKTGWTVATGTPSRATYATSTVGLATLAGVVMALETDLIAHGLIGA
jgi:hypothetical protein